MSTAAAHVDASTLSRSRTRFRRDALNPRARWRLFGGLTLLVLSLAYGGWAAKRLGQPGTDTSMDKPVTMMADRLIAPLQFEMGGDPKTGDEFFLRAIVKDQQDIMFGLTVFVLRLVVASTIGGLGLVLLTAGSTEWELRSEAAAA